MNGTLSKTPTKKVLHAKHYSIAPPLPFITLRYPPLPLSLISLQPRGSAAKPRRVTTKLISKVRAQTIGHPIATPSLTPAQMIIKPEPPVLLDACVTIVEDPIRVDTVANIWKLFLEDKEEDDTDFSNNLYRFSEKTTKEKDQEIEYDMDDEVRVVVVTPSLHTCLTLT